MVAANGSSDAPVDWSHFISLRGSKWKPSAIRGLFPLEKIPGMISMLAGKPNPTTFPFSSLSVNIKPAYPGGKTETLTLEEDALTEGLQYGPTAGIGGLVQWLTKLQSHVHKRPIDNTFRVSVGSGSQDLIYKAMQSLINDGDSILLETPVYPGTLGILIPETANLIEIATDTQGLVPASLEHVLSTWSTTHPTKRFPKLLYTIPTGSNPTGCSSPLSRKLEILALARKYNLLIMEDDAYYFIHFDRSVQAPSYFQLEMENGGTPGRVVRFDSFSKILSSGMRLGFMTAAPEIVDIVDLHTANTNLQPSSIAQSIVLALLLHWGHQGFIEHTIRVAEFYRIKRDMFEIVAHRHLDGLASWVSPDCGMFLFLNLHLNKDPSIPGDSLDLIKNKAVAAGFLAVPGVSFMPNGSTSSFVRVSFSLAEEEDANEAFKRLRAVILEARGETEA